MNEKTIVELTALVPIKSVSSTWGEPTRDTHANI